MVARKIAHRHDEAELPVEPVPAGPKSSGMRGRVARYDLSPRTRLGHRSRWVSVLSTGGFTALCVLIAYHVFQSVFLSQRAAYHVEQAAGLTGSGAKTLAFSVCNGMANQRLSILYGVVLASELGRVVVLPDFELGGSEGRSIEESIFNSTMVPMSDLYDVPHFTASLASVGLEVLDRLSFNTHLTATEVDTSKLEDLVEALSSKQYKDVQHLSIGCPLFRLPSFYFTGANTRILWAAIEGMAPSRQVSRSVNYIVKQLRRMGTHHRFNFLHLRMEKDWQQHCDRWQHIPDGRVRNNCMNNTDSVDQVLELLNFSPLDPLFVSVNWAQADPQESARILAKLEDVGYQVHTSTDYTKSYTPHREVNSLIDYHVALAAARMLGNSVSTFSALNIFERRHRGLWASYYNGGNIPLAEFLPMDLLPWVFRYNGGTPNSDYLVKAAVRSANRHKSLRPYCLWSGNTSAPIHAWLQSEGVTMLQLEPEWASDLWEIAIPHLRDNAKLSHIFESREALIANFQVIDLPLIPELDQYIYVLVTDPDVFFYRKVSLSSFPTPLPEVLGMAHDLESPMGMDGGVMLMNLPALRDLYEELKLFVLGNRHGGNYNQYGVGAAGALKQFFAQNLKGRLLSSHFSAKPFKDFDSSAYIVHFKGPKPHDYLSFYKTLDCPVYGALCEQGFRKGLCQYVKKWQPLMNETEDETAITVWYICLALYAPHLKGLARHKLAQTI